MATDSIRFDDDVDEAPAFCACCPSHLAGAIIIRIHGPVRASSIVLKYVHILYSISLWYLHISRRDPGLSFAYVCAYIRSERL